ncbi:hypothetical protein RFI_38867 [Reticulomyxa filosa]|uniref:Uncharacterized protein n=1 Tax=Reticulomyxa filosa TaxID=46433 RepID=X6LB70_RETFI|nr:hypothetical protein RFI_38867 [Reticulomyxa filosa]|eukprot:ETN98625.1 hypothetical protein RFI_38867 [Reticulomyxa filosa]
MTPTATPAPKMNPSSIDSKTRFATTSTTSTTSSVLGTVQIPKEKEVVVQKEKEAEKWDGPLSRYNTYPSNQTPKQYLQVIEETLTILEKDGFNVFGRMYHKFDMSEFMVNVYISSDNQYQSVVKIRRSSGDTFVHDEFFRRISKHLQERQVLEHKDDEHQLDFDLSFELDNLSFDNLGPGLSSDFLLFSYYFQFLLTIHCHTR